MSQVKSFSSVRERIEYLLDISGLSTLPRLATHSGVPIKTLRGVLKRNAIGPKTAECLSERLNIAYKWIKDGEGMPPYSSTPENHLNDTPSPLCTIIDPWSAGEHLVDGFDDQGGDEKSSVRVRLKRAMEYLNIETGIAMAIACGLSSDLLGEIMAKDEIDATTARFVAERLGIELNWLLRGEGPMQKKGSEIEGFKGESSHQAAETLTPPTSPLKTGERIQGMGPAFAMVPKATAKLSAGGGIIPEEGTTGEEYAFRLDWLKQVATSTRNVILIDVDGDSMTPTLLDKDTVLIDTGRTELRGGRIYAIAIGDVVQIKRLQWLAPELIKVIADNPAYYTHEIHPKDIRIIGQMIWSARTWV